ncbi:E3 ubiquitin-protein ligase siah2 isoform X2 [Folsomia candida]|uniref:E3 ubiquitin-protein ligase siah2 isoform X2 n=1 Tax=Folsomia candida TaxID=158441 RepID=UPI001605559F|nr:E3 ubiquitin-protein ligase siah2 isoform X2 [Folsomia candida]
MNNFRIPTKRGPRRAPVPNNGDINSRRATSVERQHIALLALTRNFAARIQRNSPTRIQITMNNNQPPAPPGGRPYNTSTPAEIAQAARILERLRELRTARAAGRSPYANPAAANPTAANPTASYMHRLHPFVMGTLSQPPPPAISPISRPAGQNIGRGQTLADVRHQSSVFSPAPIPTEVAEIDASFDLEELLTCPVCFEMCRPPISQCVQGHILCCECKPKVNGICPVCRQQVIPTMRNRALESVYNATKFACKYKDFGCAESVRGDKFQEHVDKCTKRAFICTFGNDHHRCTPTSTMRSIDNKLDLHFIQDHSTPRLNSGQYCSHSELLVPGTHIPLACWDFDGRTFLETMYVTTTHFFINMLLIGEKSDATKYAADIQVIKTGVDCAPNIRKCILPIPVRSIRMKASELQNISVTFPNEVFQITMARLDISGRYCWMTRVDLRVQQAGSGISSMSSSSSNATLGHEATPPNPSTSNAPTSTDSCH